ncbi:MAG: cupin domain-containing protein [Actinobacteria bacterium]|nr:cupin domain-containing protein [Actinomycetota bacterium]
MSFDLIHRDDFERNGNWALVRRSLGVDAFGINLVTIPAGESIPEHDEVDRDQEEVFVFLSGEPEMVVDGVKTSAPPGTFCRLDPEHKRTVVNDGNSPADVLIVSAPRTSGYTDMGWG